MIKKNSFKTVAVAVALILALTACNNTTASTPELPSVSSEPVTTSAQETTEVTEEASETSGESLISTEDSESTEASGETDSTEPTEAGKTDAETTATETTKKTSETTTAETTAAETTTAATTTAETSTAETTAAETTTAATTTQETEHRHSYTSEVIKEPTCTETGIIKYSCACGDSYTETTPARGHSFGAYVYNNNATEYADGTETATCSVCGATDTRTAPGTRLVHTHSYTETVTANPTCTEDGVKTYTCACGDSYTESIPATGHCFGDYIYNNDATTTSDGTETAICLVCGATDTRIAVGTMLTLPSWYDEHPDKPLNVATGSKRDGTLEMYFTDGGWDDAANGCWDFGYSMTSVIVGEYAEGWVSHGYLYISQ